VHNLGFLCDVYDKLHILFLKQTRLKHNFLTKDVRRDFGWQIFQFSFQIKSFMQWFTDEYPSGKFYKPSKYSVTCGSSWLQMLLCLLTIYYNNCPSLTHSFDSQLAKHLNHQPSTESDPESSDVVSHKSAMVSRDCLHSSGSTRLCVSLPRKADKRPWKPTLERNWIYLQTSSDASCCPVTVSPSIPQPIWCTRHSWSSVFHNNIHLHRTNGPNDTLSQFYT